jgi:uncharacterized protein
MTTTLITGASSGIGAELAIEFAKHKHNLVLVARSEYKLKELADALKAKYKVEVHVLVKDLSNEKHVNEIYGYTQFQNLQVDYLINNAGFGDYNFFYNADWGKMDEMIEVNIKALTRLSWLYVRDMVQNKGGRIMNVASTAAFQPGPMMAVYFATKSYVLLLSEALANELEEKGITVTALCPGATESGFMEAANLHESKLAKSKKLPSSAEVARYGYKAMMKGKKVAIHGTMNYLMAQSPRFFPRNMVTKVVRFIQKKAIG